MDKEIILLKQDWSRYTDGVINSTIYSDGADGDCYIGYDDDDFKWFLTEYTPADNKIVEDISEFIDLRTGRCFFTHYKEGNPIVVLEKLEAEHTLLMLKTTNISYYGY